MPDSCSDESGAGNLSDVTDVTDATDATRAPIIICSFEARLICPRSNDETESSGHDRHGDDRRGDYWRFFISNRRRHGTANERSP